MISKQNMLEMINEEVIFRGFARNNIIINDELNYNQLTDWNASDYPMHYIGKPCRVLGQNEDGSIQCEFEQCDMQGNLTDEGLTSIDMDFEFAASSNGLIDYDPVFERIQQNIIHVNPNPVINNFPIISPILNNNIIQNTILNVELWQIIEEQLNDIP
jgi:hypothetical protein